MLRVDLGQSGQVIDGGADVVHAHMGIFQLARFTLALSLIAGIKGQRDETGLCQVRGIEAGGLLLDATGRVNADDGGVAYARLQVSRQMKVAGQAQVLIGKANGVHGVLLGSGAPGCGDEESICRHL